MKELKSERQYGARKKPKEDFEAAIRRLPEGV